jgi:hypothetical protein
MAKLKWNTGTILRFVGVDNRKVHMGFVWDSTRVMELIAGKEGETFISRIYLTNTDKPHPLKLGLPKSQSLPQWEYYESPPSSFSQVSFKKQILSAIEEFDGSEYHQVYKNCQHFVYKAVCGLEKSPDADKWQWVGWLGDDGGVSASLTSYDRSSEICQKYREEALSTANVLKKIPSSQIAGMSLEAIVKVSDFMSNYPTHLMNSMSFDEIIKVADSYSRYRNS